MQKECLHVFRKSDNEEIRISAREYRNKHYFDIRLFYKPPDSENADMFPTKKGVTLPLNFIGDVEKGISLVKKHYRSLEMVP